MQDFDEGYFIFEAILDCMQKHEQYQWWRKGNQNPESTSKPVCICVVKVDKLDWIGSGTCFQESIIGGCCIRLIAICLSKGCLPKTFSWIWVSECKFPQQDDVGKHDIAKDESRQK